MMKPTISFETLLGKTRCRAKVDCQSKKKAIETLSHLVAEGLPQIDVHDIFQQLIERERLGSTGIGHGVAIPHIRHAKINTPVCAFISLAEPTDFQSQDHEAVDLIFALLVPENAAEEHLQLLATLAGILNDADNRSALRDCQTHEALWQCFIERSKIGSHHEQY